MLYSDFAVAITTSQAAGYPISAVVQGLGRVSSTLPPLSGALADLLAEVADQPNPSGSADRYRAAGAELFRWLVAEPLGTHLRVAWDRATQAGQGLRILLSIDPPELAALPWEMLRDPERDHTFATRVSTPLVRFFDQANAFGGFAEQEAELPLNMLVVLPSVPDLDLAKEKRLIEEATRSLKGSLNLRILEGPVTRTALADTLMSLPYHIVHFAGHGAYIATPGSATARQRSTHEAAGASRLGQVYIQLNWPDGAPDWIDEGSLVRLLTNHRSLRMLVLNLCSSGRVDAAVAFQGLAPGLVRAGIPAVVAMQYPLTDQAALAFARELYRQLCMGEDAGQIDVAVSHARNMLAVAEPNTAGFAAPVLYTHAANGTIFDLPQESAVQAVLDPKSVSARLAMFMGSLESSMAFSEDWTMAGPDMLEPWRQRLLEAERAYCTHLNDSRPPVQQAARHGLTLVKARLAALEGALNANGH